MARRLLYIVMLFLATTMWSCQKSSDKSALPTGDLVLSMDAPLGCFVAEDSISETKSVDDIFDNYRVKIVRLLSGEYIYIGSWGDMAKEMELESGVYTITIESCELTNGDFDNHYYYLSSKFAIDKSEKKELNLQCVLANIMVAVDFSESFLECYSDYSIEIDNGAGSVNFTPLSAYRSANFALSEVLDVRFTGYNIISDRVEELEYTIDDIHTQDLHSLYFDGDENGVLMEHTIFNNGIAIGH